MTSDTAQDEMVALLAKVANQDRQAFQRLYQRAAGQMLGVCVKLAGQRELAEEAVQDAFIRIWHHASEYHPERGKPLTWMLTIARNRTLDLMRARKVRQTDGDEALATVAVDDDPLDSALQASSSDILQGCMGELSDQQRDTIMLSYYRGFTHDELATALNTPVGTVKSWIRRGLLALKRCLER
ncbi:MAG: sigma-70 family RNA polymerase sigma factor [Marinobacter sp.]|nr:sigma-70 family RNA polymerase sigma factor [Marinobacter sp.]